MTPGETDPDNGSLVLESPDVAELTRAVECVNFLAGVPDTVLAGAGIDGSLIAPDEAGIPYVVKGRAAVRRSARLTAQLRISARSVLRVAAGGDDIGPAQRPEADDADLRAAAAGRPGKPVRVEPQFPLVNRSRKRAYQAAGETGCTRGSKPSPRPHDPARYPRSAVGPSARPAPGGVQRTSPCPRPRQLSRPCTGCCNRSGLLTAAAGRRPSKNAPGPYRPTGPFASNRGPTPVTIQQTLRRLRRPSGR
jgi:hypothetical protein